MVYGIFLTLDQKRWYREDFSSENKLTGTIFTDVNKTTTKNLTGFTLTVRMNRIKAFGDFFNKVVDIVVAADGTWSFAVGQGEIPPRGIYFVKVELTKAGVRESTLNRVELHILEGPSA